MDTRNNNRRNVLSHARVTFSQPETSSLLRGGGINRKDPKISPEKTQTPLPKNSESFFGYFRFMQLSIKKNQKIIWRKNQNWLFFVVVFNFIGIS